MKPAPFKYVGVETLDDAIAVLGEYGDEAKVLAGGQSLIPLMNLRLARPAVLVDINRIGPLDELNHNGGLTVGALTRQAALLRSREAASVAPMIAAALRLVGHPGIRARGTVGGSIAHADPAAELPVVLLALGGEVTARGPGGERTIAAEDLFVGSFTTSLGDDEVLTHVHFPAPADGHGWSFHEVARRHGDFALVGAAVSVERGEGGDVTEAKVALSGVADRPIRSHPAEEALRGRALDEDAIGEAAQLAGRDLDPPSDIHASGRYRKQATEALVKRALNEISNSGGRR